MKTNRYYSIGQASKICDVSPRMLRYYEEIGLIHPDKISEETQHKIEYYHQRLDSLKGWCGLIIEGKEALRHRAFSPHITYLPKRLYFYYER